uniref:Placenta-specific gene 8 protein n=1 Tax=Balaenoptera musculus TaxID=9771 RepID=A0A8C0CBJ2_BALMU
MFSDPKHPPTVFRGFLRPPDATNFLFKDDPNVNKGLCGTFFPLCLSCQIASDMNECCLCGASVAMRTMYRTRYGISGSICNDFLWLACFPNCTLCQLKRDIEKRKAMNAL